MHAGNGSHRYIVFVILCLLSHFWFMFDLVSDTIFVIVSLKKPYHVNANNSFKLNVQFKLPTIFYFV